MISQSDIELLNSLIKWNGAELNSSEIIIKNTAGENQNLTNYHILSTPLDTEVINTSIRCRKSNSSNTSDFSELCEAGEDYDGVEISVVLILCLLIVVTVIGNTLIIAAVVTTKRLRTVTNCFVTSLAAADLMVGIFVMPPAIAVHITGELIVFYKSNNFAGIFRQSNLMHAASLPSTLPSISGDLAKIFTIIISGTTHMATI